MMRFGFRACGVALSASLALGFSGSAVLAQSETEAKFVMQDIKSWLPGQYDNEPQTYLEAAFGASEEGSHQRSYVTIDMLSAEDDGLALFELKEFGGGRHEALSQRQIWVFELAGSHVLMSQFAVSNTIGTVQVDALGAPACVMRWMRGQDGVYAEKHDDGQGQVCGQNAEVTLSNDSLWVLNLSDDTKRGDGIPFKFDKARELECFVYATHTEVGAGASVGADAGDRTVLNPIYLHDRGDTYGFTTKEADPQNYTLHLRRSLWASRSGRNFVPLLSLTLYRGRGTSGEIAGNAWADGDSTRVGFDAGGRVGARCKHFTERRPEAR